MFLSIIIATYNRCQLLPRVLESILHQKLNGIFDFEVLLVDNNSTDQTRKVVDDFAPLFNGKLHYFFEKQKGKAFAVNRAIKESKGEILIFTDDDVAADDLWLVSIVECFKQYQCDGVGGRILAEYPSAAPQWIRDNADLLAGPIVLYDQGQETKPYTKFMYEFLGANFAFKKSLFEELGGLKTNIGPGRGTFGDDTELVNRFFKAGKKLYYCGKAVVWHPVENYRMNLSYIGAWNVGLGRYRFIGDDHGQLNRSVAYCFGMPRYLLGVMAQNTMALVINFFNKRKFLMAWIDLSRNWGRATEMRKVYYAQI